MGLFRLQLGPVLGVMGRDVQIFFKRWPAVTFSSIVDSTVYLLAFGFGFGALVPRIDGFDYIEYVGTGVVASAALYASVFSGMFNSFIRREFQRTYDALLAAPVEPEEIVTAEVLWLAIRAGIFCMAPLLVALAFGLTPLWTIVFVPFVGFLTGFGFAAFGVLVAALADSIDNFSYVTSAVVTPLFLVSGTFFPLEGLPDGAEQIAELNPLYHCVELVRGLVLTGVEVGDLWHVFALVVFAIAMWALACWRQRVRLID